MWGGDSMNEVLGCLTAVLVLMVVWPFVTEAIDRTQARPAVVFSPRTESMLHVCKILLGECVFGTWLPVLLAGALTDAKALDEVFGAVRSERSWVGPAEVLLIAGGLFLLAVVETLEIHRSLGPHQSPTAGSSPSSELHEGEHPGTA